MVTLDLLRVDRKVQGPLELVSYWSHSKPHTKAQLDNQLVIKGEIYKILFLRET